MTDDLRTMKQKADAMEHEAWVEFSALVVDCGSIIKELDPIERKVWLASIVQERHAAQGGLCPLCNEPVDIAESHRDHVIPFIYGGGNEHTNLQVVHPRCNQVKGKRVDPWDLLRYLEGRYMNL